MEHVCIRVEVVFDVLKHYQYLFFPLQIYVLPFIDGSREVQVFKIDCYFSRTELGAFCDCVCVNVTVCLCVCASKSTYRLGYVRMKKGVEKMGKKELRILFSYPLLFSTWERVGNLKWILYEL